MDNILGRGAGGSQEGELITQEETLTGRVIGELWYLSGKTTEKIHHMDCTKWQSPA